MFVVNGVVADTRVVKEAATLSAAGHEVVVLGMREGGQPRTEPGSGAATARPKSAKRSSDVTVAWTSQRADVSARTVRSAPAGAMTMSPGPAAIASPPT